MSARRIVHAALGLAAAAAVPHAARAQSLAARVAGAPDGPLQLTYAARPGACGDGRDVVSLGSDFTAAGSAQIRGWSGERCVPGPARLVLTVRGGAVADLRVHVGPARGEPAGVRELGAVPAAEAAALALDLAARLTGRGGQRAVVAAVLADSADVWRELLALARGGAAEERTREAAIHWLGAVAPPAAVAPVTAVARDDGQPRGVRQGALAALALAPESAGVAALVGLTRGGADGWLREKAIFWLGQADDARAGAALRALASGDTVARGAREQAIFALGHGRAATRAEAGAFLRALYARVPEGSLREKVIQGVAQSAGDAAGRRWLLDLAAAEREPLEARKQALFWAGQQGDVPVADLLAVYPKLAGPELRKHFAFVLSQREDDAAVEGLIGVARRDPDATVRRQAMFWLGHSRSPLAARFLAEVVSR
jgi:hypothetical protein